MDRISTATERASAGASVVDEALLEVRMVGGDVLRAAHGWKARSTMHAAINDGTLIEGIALAPRCHRWLVSEVRALAAARAGGASKEDLRVLVAKLRQARKDLASRYMQA